MKTVEFKKIMEYLMFPEGVLKDIYSMSLVSRIMVGSAIILPVMLRMSRIYRPLTRLENLDEDR